MRLRLQLAAECNDGMLCRQGVGHGYFQRVFFNFFSCMSCQEGDFGSSYRLGISWTRRPFDPLLLASGLSLVSDLMHYIYRGLGLDANSNSCKGQCGARWRQKGNKNSRHCICRFLQIIGSYIFPILFPSRKHTKLPNG